MTRTTAREIAVHLAYEMGYSDRSAEQFLEEKLNRDYFASMAEAEELYREFPDKEQLAYIRQVIEGVGRHGYELDSDIERYAKGWKFSRIPRVAAAIMRVAMYEILYMSGYAQRALPSMRQWRWPSTMRTPEVVSFVNGILGSFVRQPSALEPVGSEAVRYSRRLKASDMRTVLGIDTSNYTTSAAVFRRRRHGLQCGPSVGCAAGRAGPAAERRPVSARSAVCPSGWMPCWKPGELPALSELAAVGASAPPPGGGGLLYALLPGAEASRARVLARRAGGAVFRLLPPAGACGCRQPGQRRSPRTVWTRPMLAWHLSGGTTELLLTRAGWT